ncbi:MAG: phosphodiester glycosidase family protein, partial [Cyanobacteria bacterium P01_A01_bin.37]
EQHAQTSGAIAAINAGFFDPNNQRTTSYVTIDGAIVADPRDNSRLVSNPDLISYLDAILNRSEFRHMTCSGQPSFSIAFHRDDLPSPSCILHDAVGGGPRLLPDLQSVEEGFLAYGADGHVIRDAIGSLSPNARSAVGITETGEIVLAMAAQRPEVGDRTGMSLPELADFLSSLGVRDALNLDGGSSSALYVDGTMHYGRFDEERTPVQRPVKSVLLIRSRSLSD